MSKPSKVMLAVLAGVLVAITAFVVRVLARTAPDKLEAHTDHPAPDYETAMARVAHLCVQEEALRGLNPVCHSRALTHGRKVERAIVLMHGMTNCPQQYVALAPLLHERGYNVLMLRIPYNGYTDPDTEALKDLTAEQLRDCTEAAVDIARGLGERVTFAGISAGGTMAAWVAQNRADVEKAVLIAPAFTVTRRQGVMVSRLVMRLFLTIPNIMTQRLRPFTGAVGHNYHGFATRGLGQLLRFGFSIYDAARTTKPAAQSLLAITNAADPAVNNSFTQKLIRRWRASGLKQVETYEFDAKYHLIHDLVDPAQQEQQTALVYPILLSLITREQGD